MNIVPAAYLALTANPALTMNPVLADFLWACAALGFLALCFLGASALRRRVAMSPELSRKLVHMAMAAVVLPFPWLFTYRGTVVIIGVLATAGLLTLRLRSLRQGAGFGSILYGVDRARSVGELVYPPAVVVTYLIAPTPQDYVIPILVLGFADSIAALVGTEYAKLPLAAERESPKSLEGAVAFACAAFICVVSPLLLLSDWPGHMILLVSLLMAALSSMLELVCSLGLDNFFIPFFISVFLRRLYAYDEVRLLISLVILLVCLSAAFYYTRRMNFTRLGAVEALLALFLTGLFGGYYWLVAPLVLAFSYSVFPSLSVAERERPLNYHVIETNLIPGLLMIIAGSLLGMAPWGFWMYSAYYACLTAKNYSLRLFNFFPQLPGALPTAWARGCLLQLLPAAGIYRVAYGAWPPVFALAWAMGAILLEIVLCDVVARRANFPLISLRLGWISGLSSAAFGILAAIPYFL
jgi:dolichol kinase